jgi:hypothetical protein
MAIENIQQPAQKPKKPSRPVAPAKPMVKARPTYFRLSVCCDSCAMGKCRSLRSFPYHAASNNGMIGMSWGHEICFYSSICSVNVSRASKSMRQPAL